MKYGVTFTLKSINIANLLFWLREGKNKLRIQLKYYYIVRIKYVITNFAMRAKTTN